MKVNIGPYPKNAKGKRRIKIQIDRYDTWSMDDTLAMIILPMLKQLRKTKQGAPRTEDEDVPKNLRSTHKSAKKKGSDGTDSNWFKRWDWILDEMIWAFEEYTKDWEKQFHSGKIDLKFEKIEGSTASRLVKGPKDTHKFDRKGYEKHLARIQNGFRLFGKYYMALWD